ncbi:FAD-binding and (Fe-S)-binding domain-containing protein [Arthrobacter sp. H14-L1]|uniref:FAD-binding and (Fe-S)-binding domain-containing protein n=1 Tax=Arthrobacter sp. H14-L1 TaxID=2996697 RepID=UPI00227014CD|nr:FAD-binding oxidoreductase [Arthrobacter sp. H14-L1]MCY0903741.1 FAD-binding protein [Arthrobacter sp. H14-L1]
MTRVDLPEPVVRPADPAAPVRDLDPAGLEKALRERVDGEVRFDPGSRAAYSTDASNYRQLPVCVVVPRTVEAAAETMLVCRDFGAPVLSRGGGTSLAGQCTNAAVVVDFSKYCTALLSVDVQDRSCRVEPGIVLDELNAQLAAHGLEFGPEPATHNHCTLAGIVGNNSCGATAQRTGKTVDNTLALEVMLPDGTRMDVSTTEDQDYAGIVRSGGRKAEIYRQLRTLRDTYGADVRAAYPDIPRRVSCYNLDSLLPENTNNLAQALVGSESTCVLLLRAKLRLMPVVRARSVVLLGYPDAGSSGDDVPAVLEYDPIALEGFDAKVISYQQVKGLNAAAIRYLPEGQGAWLLVQFGADTPEQAGATAQTFAQAAQQFGSGPTVTVFDDDAHQQQIRQVREAPLGATAQVPGLANMWSGWEDSAVAPEQIGRCLRELGTLYQEFGFDTASLYGHYGQGCVHTRIPFDLVSAAGVAKFREFMERAARLVVSLGGSLSGEHGDGQSRAELLPIMYGPQLIRAFAQFKAIFDPGNRMNPGKMDAPYRIDENLRLGTTYQPAQLRTHFAFPADGGSFDAAVLGCVGVGKCRRHAGGVMCVLDGWRSTAVFDALDLCLACKGCKKDCPVNVGMATYKAEFLSHHYAGRLRPRAHYSMGWLPVWAQLACRLPRVSKALSQAPGLSRLALAAAGAAPQRRIPQFAPQTFQSWYRQRGPRGTGHRGPLVLWPDTFSNSFPPHVAQAAVEVLEAAGWEVVAPEEAVCCGLTWISTGQLDVAKKVLQRTVHVFSLYLRAGTLILALEPSCTAVFRSDAAELFPHDPDVQRLRQQSVTLAELLTEHSPGWKPPPLARRALIQTHCHQHAVMGFDADLSLLQGMGVNTKVLDSGCCGLTGNFGFETGHFDVSTACGERVLFPALRAASTEDVVLADGFSCRTQIEQGDAGGREGMHLAELLAAALFADSAGRGEEPERAYTQRPHTSRKDSYVAVAAVVLLTAGALAAAAAAVSGRRAFPPHVCS